jgi:competence protein ComEA
MHPALREALSRAVARVIASPFAKPIARVALAAAGLVLLAFIGHSAIAGAVGASQPSAVPTERGIAAGSAPPALSPVSPASEPAPGPMAATAKAAPFGALAPPTNPASISSEIPTARRTRASPEDPVVLNAAGVEELRRLPGIGDKRATAILELRAHLGRFRAIEDLLKVKGIGRATLRRLRPLVRLDPLPVRDAGAAEPR